jgi:adenine/guanine/hypoxanthine permease
MLARIRGYYEFERWGTDFRTEAVGGLTTFMTMAYIIFVNPAILSQAGMDFNAVLMATCLASAAATVIMGLWARYPIALAPGMGMNAFFTFEICLHYGVKWPVALGMVLVAAVLFFILTLVHVREVLINAIPGTLKYATAGGIGLFIAFIGLQGAGLIVADPATMLRVGDLSAKTTLISLAALAATVILMAARVRGAIFFGIVIAGALALLTHAIAVPPGFHLLAAPPSLAPTAFKFELAPIVGRWELIALVFVLLFFMLFDTLGTLIGVAEQAGFLDAEGRLPRANRALMADAGGAMVGSLLGTSTVTCYIESATGVAAGARTGIAALVVAALFALTTFLSPAVALLAKPFVTAPALIVVGCLMMGAMAKIAWREPEEAFPAFLTMIVMPLGFSISKGMVAGLVSWPLLQLVAGKGRQVHPLMYVLAAILIAGVIADFTLLAP